MLKWQDVTYKTLPNSSAPDTEGYRAKSERPLYAALSPSAARMTIVRGTDKRTVKEASSAASALIVLLDACVLLTSSWGAFPRKKTAEMFLDYPKKSLDDGRHCHLLILHDVNSESNISVGYRDNGECFLR
jgi:hypothetical protein